MANCRRISLVCLLAGTAIAAGAQQPSNAMSQLTSLEASATTVVSRPASMLKEGGKTTATDSLKTGAAKPAAATAMNTPKPVAGVQEKMMPPTANITSAAKNPVMVDNTATGYMALQNNTDGVGNTAIGVYALQKNTTGLHNTANGSYTLASNTTGERNTALGALALTNNSGGSANTAIGYQTLLAMANGSNNTAIGHNAMVFAASGNNNTAIGTASLQKNADGNNNTSIGLNNLENNLGGSNNVSNGVRAMAKNTIGNSNTAIGFESLNNNVTGSYNTTLGYTADVTADGISNATALGSGAKVNTSNTIQLGNTYVTTVNTQGNLAAAGLTLNADQRLRQNVRTIDNGLATILQLNPVHYERKMTMDAANYTKTENGFIAQEIQKVVPFIVTEGKDKDKLLSVDYISLIPILTKALQEQQNQIQQQSEDIKALKKLVQQLLDKK